MRKTNYRLFRTILIFKYCFHILGSKVCLDYYEKARVADARMPAERKCISVEYL